MTSFDETSIRCEVRTYKEGLLSRVGHDLALRAQRLSATPDPARGWHVRVPVDGLVVVGALRDGQLDARALSAGDRAKIQQTLRREVLPAPRCALVEAWVQPPEVADAPERLASVVRLAGRERDVTWTAMAADATLAGERPAPRTGDPAAGPIYTASLDVRDFGLRPYRAAFGGLRVKAAVELRVAISAAALAALRGVT